MLGILSDLFMNVVILIASITFGNMLARDKIMTTSSRNNTILGVLCGIQGCLLMVYGVHINSNLIIDFRNIPIIITGLYSAFSSVMITSLIIGIFRVAFFGWNTVSLASFALALVMGVICGFIGKSKMKNYVKWILATISVVLVSCFGFIMFIDDRTLLHDVLSAYLLGMLIVSSFTFFLKKFIHKSNDKYYTLKASSSIDFLTGLYNVRHFDKTLNDVMTNAKDHSRCVSLLFIDIDHFKKVNDTYGHLNGDIVLKTLGELLQKQSRSSDVITRYGGEEFTVILINCGITEAKNAAERIRIMVESQEFDTRSNDKIRITVSIGVACYPETTAAEEKLIEQADIALYNAKRTGRNQVCVAQKG